MELPHNAVVFRTWFVYWKIPHFKVPAERGKAANASWTGLAAFFVAGVDVALGFVSSSMSLHWPGVLAFGVTVLDPGGGFLFILQGWWQIFNRKPGNNDARKTE
jgi:hypothetical protein